MSTGFNAWDHSGANSFVHSGFNARNGGGASIWKLDANGKVIWTYDTGGNVNGITVGLDGLIYAAGQRVGNKSAWQLTPAGSLVQAYDTGGDAQCASGDANGNAYVTGPHVAVGKYVWKFKPDGSQAWNVGGSGTDGTHLAMGDNGIYVAQTGGPAVQQFFYDGSVNATVLPNVVNGTDVDSAYSRLGFTAAVPAAGQAVTSEVISLANPTQTAGHGKSTSSGVKLLDVNALIGQNNDASGTYVYKIIGTGFFTWTFPYGFVSSHFGKLGNQVLILSQTGIVSRIDNLATLSADPNWTANLGAQANDVFGDETANCIYVCGIRA